MKEVVLPSGGFAKSRPILVSDMVAAFAQANGLGSTAILVHRCVTVDDSPLALIQVLSMEWTEACPLFTLMTNQLNEALKTKDGIA